MGRPGRVQMVASIRRDQAGEKMKDGRNVGLDFYDLLIEALFVVSTEFRPARIQAPRACRWQTSVLEAGVEMYICLK